MKWPIQRLLALQVILLFVVIFVVHNTILCSIPTSTTDTPCIGIPSDTVPNSNSILNQTQSQPD